MSKLKNVNKKKAVLVAAGVVGILLVGFGIGRFTSPHAAKQRKATTTSNAVTERRVERNTNDLDKRRNEVDAKIDAAVNAKKLTPEQGKKAKDKVNEVYEYLKKLKADNPDLGKELGKKRLEIRKWAADNNISSIYVLNIR